MNNSYLRIYCVTLPGSPRHRIMKDHLRALGADYEFVYGEVLDDAPVERICLASALHEAKAVDSQECRKAINSFSCKMAMRRAMLKFAEERDFWALIIQDDIKLPTNWKERCWKAIRECPEEVGAIAVCTRPGRKTQHSGWCSPYNCVNYTEPASIVSRQYALDNAKAMEEGGSLSDYSYYKKYKRFGVAYYPEPFAEYVGYDSYINNVRRIK